MKDNNIKKDLATAMIGETYSGNDPGATISSGYYYVVPPYDKEMKQFALNMAVQLSGQKQGITNGVGGRLISVRECAQKFYEWLTEPDIPKVEVKEDAEPGV